MAMKKCFWGKAQVNVSGKIQRRAAQWMARIAMVMTPARTQASIVTMKNAARLASRGDGWVMPMVLMKAFDMSKRNFIGWENRGG
jgi:hypothetical protein